MYATCDTLLLVLLLLVLLLLLLRCVLACEQRVELP
jgi:hypothetical protein